MRRVKQTRSGGPDVPPEERGDCWDACVASILDTSLEEVHLPHSDDPDHHWGDAAAAVLRPLGVVPLWFDKGDGWPTEGVWIAAVPSLNLGCYEDGRPVPHVVVMVGDRVWHDPALLKTYEVGTHVDDLDVLDGCMLLAIEDYERAIAESVEA